MFEFIINGPWYIIPAIIIAILAEVSFNYERIKRYTDLNAKYIYTIAIIIALILSVHILLILP